MNVLSFVMGLFMTLAAFAAPTTYHIHSQVFIDGKLISSPRIVTLAGEAAEITQTGDNQTDKFSLKVTPENISNNEIKDGILMKFDIEYTYGSRSIKSSPQVITKSGSEASVSIGKIQGKEEVLLKVTATRE